MLNDDTYLLLQSWGLFLIKMLRNLVPDTHTHMNILSKKRKKNNVCLLIYLGPST